MIIHTGMRTDIPAFYSRWFLNRLAAGYVFVRNPFNPFQVTRYRLSPDVVDLFAFCTKNPMPMLKHLDRLDAYGQYWFVTITPYGKEIEPNVPDKRKIIAAFKALSRHVGADSMGWRYDPIFLNETYTIKGHLRAFEAIASALAGYTKTCVISFIDLYEKVRRNFPEVKRVSERDKLKLTEAFVAIGRRYGMTIKPCAEGDFLAKTGADTRGCMTIETFETALHQKLAAPKRQGARKACACYLACDIGAYNTCGHLCRYCYANADEKTVRHNMAAHDPDSPFLTGGAFPEDVIHDAVQESWRENQVSFFDAM